MRNFIVLILSILFIPFGQAQITEATKVMSQGDNNALMVTLPDTEVKVVEKEWESFIKNYKAKLRKIKKSSEIFADDAKMKDISDNTVDVYALVSKRGENTELAVWYDLGGTYLSSETHPNEYKEAEGMLNTFLGKVSKTYIAMLLAEEEKKLKDMDGELKALDKAEENAIKDIEKYEAKIEEARANIEQCKTDRVGKMKNKEMQKGVIKKVKGQLNN